MPLAHGFRVCDSRLTQPVPGAPMKCPRNSLRAMSQVPLPAGHVFTAICRIDTDYFYHDGCRTASKSSDDNLLDPACDIVVLAQSLGALLSYTRRAMVSGITVGIIALVDIAPLGLIYNPAATDLPFATLAEHAEFTPVAMGQDLTRILWMNRGPALFASMSMAISRLFAEPHEPDQFLLQHSFTSSFLARCTMVCDINYADIFIFNTSIHGAP